MWTDLLELVRSKPFMMAVVAGLAAQTLKVFTFLLVEKRVNFKRFVQTDGSPNMHSAAVAALALAVGAQDGYDSITFAFAVCLLALIMVDTWNVKRRAYRHKEVIVMIMDKLQKPTDQWARRRDAIRYGPLDVVLGTMFGLSVALLLL